MQQVAVYTKQNTQNFKGKSLKKNYERKLQDKFFCKNYDEKR